VTSADEVLALHVFALRHERLLERFAGFSEALSAAIDRFRELDDDEGVERIRVVLAEHCALDL
jgi:hypothetical protein